MLAFFMIGQVAIACDACQLQQPKATQGLTHGAGPSSSWDWVIVAVMALITIATLIFSLKYLIHPGEKKSTHIKNTVINP